MMDDCYQIGNIFKSAKTAADLLLLLENDDDVVVVVVVSCDLSGADHQTVRCCPRGRVGRGGGAGGLVLFPVVVPLGPLWSDRGGSDQQTGPCRSESSDR